MQSYQTVDQSQVGAVLTISLNRPNNHNALNSQMISELTTAFKEIDVDSGARIVVLTGRGRSFCAGADLSQVKYSANKSHENYRVEGQILFDLMMEVAHCPLPVVCRVNGAAIGGGVGLVSCCDVVVAVEKAMFGFSEVRLGLIPAVISPFVLAKIGISKTRELFLTGDRFDADYAKNIGLVHYVVSTEGLDSKVNDLVVKLLLGAPGAQTDSKRLIDAIRNKPILETREYTSELFARRWNSTEGKEGILAYLEKRKPDWQG